LIPAPLRSRPLAALLVGEAVSSLGSQMTFLALPWFVLVTTGSATRMGIVLAVELTPVALLGIPSGGVIARYGARRTMMFADLCRAPVLAAVPLLHSFGVLDFWLLLVLVALVGVFIAPSFAAQRLVLPELVGEDETVVAQANAVFEGVLRATGLLGPVTAGLLISAFGAPAVLYVDAASFLFAFVMLWLFVPQRPPKPGTDESRGVLAGVRFIRRDTLLAVLGATALLINMFSQMLVASLPVLAFDDFGGSPRVAGAFFAAFGLGAVVGSVLAVRLVPKYEPVRLGAVAFAAMTVPIWFLVLPLQAAGVVLALAVSALFGPLINAPLIGVITMRTPDALRPKVMTAIITLAMLAGPIGLLVAGPLLESFGPQAVFLLIAAGESLAVIPFAVFAFRRPTRLPPHAV